MKCAARSSRPAFHSIAFSISCPFNTASSLQFVTRPRLNLERAITELGVLSRDNLNALDWGRRKPSVCHYLPICARSASRVPRLLRHRAVPIFLRRFVMPLQKPANSQGTLAKGTIGLLLVGVVAAAMVVAARRPAANSNEAAAADMQ